MAVLQMQKICICAQKKDQEAILDRLQAVGVMEISQETGEETEKENGFTRMDTMSSRQQYERKAGLAEQALEVLQAYMPEKISMFSSLEGKMQTEKMHFQEVSERAEVLLRDAEGILALQKQMAEQQAQIAKLEAKAESLIPWMQLEIPLACQSTKRTQILVGTIGMPLTLEQIYQAVSERESELEAFDLEIAGSDRDQVCLVAVSLKKDAGRLEEALRSIGFVRVSVFGEAEEVKTPAEYAEALKRQTEELKQTIEEIRNELIRCADKREELKLISDFWRLQAQKEEISSGFLQSKRTFLVTGFVPKRSVEELKRDLTESFLLSFEAEDVPEEEESPVLLSNHGFASCAEGITESFGLPGKGELDPTNIMALCYVFLFGLMLSDAAYGLMVSLTCLILLKRFPRMGESMKKSIRLFMYCGWSTLFWGVMFGGYFGDAVDIVSRVYLGKEVSIPALWFIPLNNPMKLLLYSMLFGVIHLYLGLGMKGYLLLRDGKVKDFIYDVGFWYLMLTGLILMLIPTDLFAPILQMTVVFPPFVTALAKWMAICGALGIFLMSARENKNPVLRLALGAYDLYNLTGWLSDVLSYSRLLALGLATGVIASVINQMGSMAGKSIFGIVIFIAVFIVGHILNLAINLLGAYVHTCRLQYVEFFGKFYEGGGRAFQPFKQNTKYVEIKED